MELIQGIFYVVILMLSVIIHEIAHGYAALSQGDPTAKLSGRLTMNPIKHLDPIGSIFLPLILVLTNAGFIIGWAKPVPYNPNNLRNFKWGTLLVASAGIISNLVLAIVFGLLIRFSPVLGLTAPGILQAFSAIVIVNIILAIFNLIPIPPLDGSKILFSLLPSKYYNVQRFLEQYSLVILLFFIFFLWQSIAMPILYFLFLLLTGISL